MHHLRFRITSALGAIVFVAVGFAALREADEQWENWLFSLTLGLLLVAVLLAVHRSGARRAFWIGFALFGWGYLSLSLIPATKSRLITTNGLDYLNESSIFLVRAYRMRAVLDLDRMRAHNVSSDDLVKALTPTRMLSDNESYENFMKVMVEKRIAPAQPGQAAETVEHVLSWGNHNNKPEQFGNIIVRANPEGELLRISDVAKVEVASSIFIPRLWANTTEYFMRIGHTLFALLAAWLGGVISQRFRRVARTPEVFS